MKRFTVKDIEGWGPCYSPNKFIPEDWSGTVLDILDIKDAPFSDRLWAILRTDLVSEKLMRLFAVWCARQVKHLMLDGRSLKALDVAERFAHGEATEKELAAARDAAWYAATETARHAAWAAATETARDAARSASWTAAVADAAETARAAARSAQEAKLREMLINGVETGDVY